MKILHNPTLERLFISNDDLTVNFPINSELMHQVTKSEDAEFKGTIKELLYSPDADTFNADEVLTGYEEECQKGRTVNQMVSEGFLKVYSFDEYVEEVKG